jgi:quercetin dioxygenase-like cupin family protein
MWRDEPPSQNKPAHWQDYEVVGYVISGRAELEIEGQTVRLKPGDSRVVPAGSEHTYRILKTFTAVEARGQLFPTLLRIALVFGVGLEHFFVDTSERPAMAVVRKDDRLRLPDRPGEEPSYYFESLDFPVTDRKLQAFHAEFPTQSKASESHQHAGAELIYVLKGQLVVSIAGDDVVLNEGGAVYFDSGAPHSYRRESRSACSAIVVTAAK